jgi:hypothetical protein
MPNVGHSIRAFRPSHYGQADEYVEEVQLEKLANLEVYAHRAEAGLPLFEDPCGIPGGVRPAKKVVSRR